ncbi:hypothetical protein BTVI_03250 [Pitangus sulphuratus]|nr:hypothetical protein BTVI_03250 [Pitangus sulphuratus]
MAPEWAARGQIIGYISADKAGPRPSHDGNPQVRIRAGRDNLSQVHPSLGPISGLQKEEISAFQVELCTMYCTEDFIDVISPMFTQWSWESGEVPVDWKLTDIVPVFKKGKKEDPRNYRSISLTSLPGKAMEKIILGDDLYTDTLTFTF